MSGSVFIGTTEYRVAETIGTVNETIERTGSLSGDVTITYGLTGDTATAGQDFVGGFGTVVMPSGASEVTVPVQILDDNLAEATERFTFSIVNVDNGTLFAPRTSNIYILDDETPAPPPPVEPPLVSSYNVTATPLVSGLDQPLRIVQSPIDPSNVYVAEKPGVIAVANLTTGAVTPMIDLSANVNDSGDRGLLSIALHPDFAHNPYIYATIVIDPSDSASQTGLAGPDGTGNRYAELVRFTADASTGYTTLVPGSEVVLLGGAGQSLADISGGGAEDFTGPGSNDPSSERYLNPAATTPPVVINGIKQDYWKVDSSSHVGGSLAFGPDGALYVSIGDGTGFDYADPRTVDVQSTDSLSGKILRIDPMTGLGLPDNPFVTPDMSLDSNAAKVYQLGIRNAFSIDFDTDGKLILSNTGWNSYEMIDTGGPGANFGWPYFEGGDGGVLDRAPAYDNFSSAGAFYAAVASGTINVTPAFRAFSHDSTAPGFQVQAITGSEVVYNGSIYPASLQNDYIFSDFPQGEIYAVNVNDRTDIKFLDQWPGAAPTDFIQGADGYIYYADIINGVIGRLGISDIPNGPVTSNVGSGADQLTLLISQDAYQGNAQYTVSVDGTQIGGIQVASATRASGGDDTVNVFGDFAQGRHTLTINFLNDAWGGTAGADRNLYLDGLNYDGSAVPGALGSFQQSGPKNFVFSDNGGMPAGGGGTTGGNPKTVTVGSGSDQIVLKIAEDAFQGDAQYTVSVDGVQIGGTLTASASQSAGQQDTVNVFGDFAAGQHTVTVNFLNDAWGGTIDADRNLYVDGMTYDGAAVAGATASMQNSGPVSFSFTDTNGGSPPPPPPAGTSSTIGSGAHHLVLKVSEDAFQGDAQYTVSVDGVQIGGTATTTASHAAGVDDTVTVLGDFAPGHHTLTVNFLNDAWGGNLSADRNLYVDGLSYDGVAVPGATAALRQSGPADFGFNDSSGTPPPPVTTSIGSGADTLSLKISEDAFQGDAQYTVGVDGVQIGGTLMASAAHGFGDDIVNVLGNFAPGNHTLVVNFLNDAWGGSANADRNLYVDGLSYNGSAVAGGTASLGQSGPVGFSFTDTSGTPPPPPPPVTNTVGTGDDVLSLKMSQDAYLGNAQYTVSVDGVKIGGTLSASALHSSGQDDTLNVLGNFAPGQHTLTVDFLNDSYGGSPTADRNL